MLALMLAAAFYLLLVLPRFLEPVQSIMVKFGRFIYITVGVLCFVLSFIAIIVFPAKYKNDYGSIFNVDKYKVWFAMQFFALLCSIGLAGLAVFYFITGGSRSSDSSSSSNSENSEQDKESNEGQN